MANDITQHDQRELYCRRLGHHLKFWYCRQAQEGLPCRGIVGCWGEQFDVGAFLNEHFSEEQLQSVFVPPKPKMMTLVELIQQAQQRQADNNES
jgi:hypothetical protein